MSTSEVKLRIFVEVGSEKLTVPLPSSLTIAEARDLIQQRARKRSEFAEIEVVELKLKSDNSLLDEDDTVGDVLRDGDIILAIPKTAAPPAAAPAAVADAPAAAPAAPDAATGSIKLYVKTLTGRTVIVMMDSLQATVLQVKEKLVPSIQVQPDNQRLLYAGRQLEDEKTLSDSNVHNESTLHLILRLGHSYGASAFAADAARTAEDDEEDEEAGNGDEEAAAPAAQASAPFNIPDGLAFAADDDSEITLKYRTPSMLPNEPSKEIKVSLNTTMERLRDILVEEAKFDVAKVVADLHLAAHPLFVAKESASLTLAQWGLNKLELFHAFLKAGSEAEDGQAPEFDPTLFVCYRSYNNENEKYTTSRRDTGEQRYWQTDAWQPFGHEQTPKGMSAFLSSLYVVASFLSSNSNEIVRFLGHFNRRIRFPPATAALSYLIRQKTIHAEQKAALATGLWHFARRLVPADVTAADDRIFEHSNIILGFLLAYAETADVSRAKDILDHFLTCSITKVRLSEPTVVPGSTKVYNKKSLLDRMEGGPMFVSGSPWASLTQEQLNIDDLSRFLLLCHPFTEEILLTRPVRAKKFPTDVESVAFPWTSVCTAVATESTSSCCNIVPSLSLRTAKVPSLTLDAESRLCVYLGPEPCSVDTVTFLSPSERKSKAVNTAMVAKALGASGRSGAKIDLRPPKEAIIVCFDTSSSMGGFSFSDAKADKDEEAHAQTLTLKPNELHAELQRLREDKYIDVYRRLARKRPASHWLENVMRQLADASPMRKALIAQQPDAVREILKSGAPANEDDDNDDDDDGEGSATVPDRFVRPADATEAFQIFIKTDGGKTVALEVDRNHTVLELKILVNSRTGTPGRRMRLTYGGRSMTDDSKKLGEYNVQPNANIFHFWDINFGRRAARSYDLQDTFGDTHEVTIHPDKTVFELKLKVWEITGQRPSQFSLWTQLVESGDGWRQGVLLDDNRRILSYNIDVLEMDKPYKRDDTRLTRIQTVKQLFHAYINRSQAYNYANHIGLMLFGSDVDYTCPITPLFEVFRDEIEECEASGETALYDALDEAVDALSEFKQQYPECKLRIIVLSDGDDTASDSEPWDVAKKIQTNNIVCDSVLIGEGSKNKMLRAISKASGGYCFAPKTLRDALKLNELETFLSLYERPDVKPRNPVKTELQLLKFADLFLYPFDICTDEQIPTRRMPDAIKAKVQALEQSHAEIERLESEEEKKAKEAGAAAPETQPAANQQNRMRRIMREISHLMRNPHPAFDVYPNTDDLSFWKIVMQGPDGCPYSGGTWLLYISFPDNYPQAAPEIRFLTPIRHANVNSYGKICHSIFTRNWTSDTTVASLLSCVYGLLLNPDCDDPIDTFLALQFFEGTGQYEALIMAHVAKHSASKTREAWRREFVPSSSSK
eukprot:TRINITY_DN4093_c0_g2_i1.p1 TRINITY_DN4093_c0_g2~~TRINITY_DN4093_c0_g2_i1.p1  ORF type:complete len:1407 (+),score=400.37 TRINITY_DN4093_c0_g2_i1:146-4366(+)